ncbi:unnamed protein product [Prorocentrum cordatum]|uniref:Uncharacterized protein n=1 Tax=Prorocentrum cordatum TaxID=2364126 RepID=A0ABN9VPS8_9DINO|nr:unnamed protein product [Polarella glacialis]
MSPPSLAAELGRRSHAAMPARRAPLLAVVLLGAAAAAALCGAGAFCGSGRAPQAAARRQGASARAALPVEAMADATSIVTALQIQQPAWAANLVLVIVPISILIIIYLQSEKTLQERDAVIGKQRL